MDGKEAIDLLKRCREHRFNLEDYQCDELVKLIQQQEKAIELAYSKINDCMMYRYYEVQQPCVAKSCKECWRKYLQSEVEK